MGARQPARRSSRGSKRGGSDRARQPSPSGHRASVLGRIERCCAYMRTTRRTLSLSARPWPARARTLKLSRVSCVPKSQNLNRGRDVLSTGGAFRRKTSNEQRPNVQRPTCERQQRGPWPGAWGSACAGRRSRACVRGCGFETSNARRYRFRNFRRRRTCRLNAERTFSQ